MANTQTTFVALLFCAAVSCSNASSAPDADDAPLFASDSAEPVAQPFPTATRRWTYTTMEDTLCRDGTPTGVAINAGPRGSKKLAIYLEQGGACFNTESCAQNPANASLDLLAIGLGVLGTDGAFNRENPNNPLRDWNIAYIPYCTGDLHQGVRADVDVPGVGPQQFVGWQNMQKFLPRIAATFPDAQTVLLTGASAGGIGSLAHAAHVRAAFPEASLRVLDDAGPHLSRDLMPECFQQKIVDLWGLAQSTLAECGADCPNAHDSFQDLAVHVARTLSDVPVGVLESAADSHLRSFSAAGAADCRGLPSWSATSYSASQLTADFIQLRRKLEPYANAGTFFIDSDQHTWTASPGFLTASAGGKRLTDWVQDLIDGETLGSFGP